jgi:phosphoribosylformylglycinamidine synthase
LNTKAQIIVMPRLGTISPWSSKASDVLHLCWLEKIKRIERGIIYHWCAIFWFFAFVVFDNCL